MVMKDEDMSFLFTCREAARNCPDILMSRLMRDAADALASALSFLSVRPTPNAMREVVACWTKAHVILQKTLPAPDDGPGQSSAGELEKLAA